MRTLKLLIIILASQSEVLSVENCLPESKLRFPVKNQKSAFGGISLAGAEMLAQRVKSVYGKRIKDLYKKELIINIDWENDRVNAHATKDENDNPVVVVRGGMIRHPEMTRDGLLMIICHELGHHYGGAPKKFRGNSNKRSWSSAEGQADYFATNKCLPLIFADGSENIQMRARGDDKNQESARNRCREDQYCIRSAMAALVVGKVFASLKPFWENPKLDLTDSSQVGVTQYKHPRPQCRLDTYIAGALCDAHHDTEFDSVDPKIGACYRPDNNDLGVRPLCWYRPAPDFK